MSKQKIEEDITPRVPTRGKKVTPNPKKNKTGVKNGFLRLNLEMPLEKACENNIEGIIFIFPS